MKFIVEVPTYVRMEVTAFNAEDAASSAESLIEQRQYIDLLHGGTFMVRDGEVRDVNVLLLDPDEDRTPDVYICRGGKLSLIESDGSALPIDLDCPIGGFLSG